MANRREKMETVTEFIFFGSKITADGDSSHEIKRLLLLGRKVMSNLDSIFKRQRHHFANKGIYRQCYSFSSSHVQMWERTKKAECWRTDAFQLWCWRRLLRVPWTARRSNQSILKEINPEYSLEGLMLKLKLQYFGHLIQKADSLAKTLMLGKIEDKRRRGQQKRRWLDSITDSVNVNLTKLRASLVAQMGKNLPAIWETLFWSLAWEDPLEEGIGTHSSILAGESHGERSLVGYSPWGCKESDMTEQLSAAH